MQQHQQEAFAVEVFRKDGKLNYGRNYTIGRDDKTK